MLIFWWETGVKRNPPTLIHGIKKKNPICQNDRAQLSEESSGSNILWDFMKFNFFLALKYCGWDTILNLPPPTLEVELNEKYLIWWVSKMTLGISYGSPLMTPTVWLAPRHPSLSPNIGQKRIPSLHSSNCSFQAPWQPAASFPHLPPLILSENEMKLIYARFIHFPSCLAATGSHCLCGV